jgi:iron complex outermembrane recepter protein
MNLRNRIILIMVLFVFANASAQTKSMLSGKVTDAATGATLPGASVYVHDAKAGTVTDNEGMYRIQNLPPGKFLVEVSYLGYGSTTDMMDIKGSVQKDFSLSPAVIENQGRYLLRSSARRTSFRKPLQT